MRRAGSGSTLLVVFSVLVLVAGLAFMHSYQGRSATLQNHRAEESERAAGLAEVALRAALHQIRRAANEPADPLFADFRSRVPPPVRILARDTLVGVDAELSRLGGFRLAGDGVSVQVLRRAPATQIQEEAIQDEALAVVRVVAKVEGPDRIEAEIREEYGARILVTALPRPFDMFTFFLGNPAGLLTKGALQGEPNVTIDMAITRLVGLKRDLEDVARELARLPAGSPGLAEATQALAQAVGPGWPARPWTAVEPAEDRSPSPDRLHRFAFPLSVYSLEDAVDLAKLDLPSRVGPLVAATEGRRDSIAAKTRSLLAAASGAAPGSTEALVEPLRALLAEVLEDVRDLDALLAAYKAFQDAMVEIDGPPRNALAARARTLGPQEVRWRSDFRFEGKGAAARAAAFLARRPGPQGVAFVGAPKGERLVLDMQGFRGRLLVAVVGDVTVRAATVADPAVDALAVVAHGELSIEGPVQAALVSWAGRLDRRPGDLAGQLVLDDLPSGADLSSLLSGTLKGLPALRSGPDGAQDRPPPDPRTIHVTLAPVASYRKTVP